MNVDSQQDTDNSNAAPVSSINVANEGTGGAEGGAGVVEEGTSGIEGGAGGVEGGAGGVKEGNGGVEEGNGGVEEDNGGVEDEDSYDESVGCSSKQCYPKKSSRSSLQKDFPDVSVMLHFVDTMFVVCLFF